ncbi:MAG: hypothetical protein R3A13_10320 [Bdellovibrionota bacterium]
MVDHFPDSNVAPVISGPPPTLSSYRIDRRLTLRRLKDVQIEKYNFEFLGNNIEDLSNAISSPDSNPELELLKEIIETTQEGWKASKEKGAATIDDSTKSLLKLITLPDARTYVARSKDGEFIGYALVLRDLKTMPDLQESTPDDQRIPKELLDHKNIFRGNRIFVKDKARDWGPFGGVVDKLLEAIFEDVQAVEDGILITNLQVEPIEYSYPWARKVFLRNGLEPTGKKFWLKACVAEGIEVEVAREWMFWQSARDGLRTPNEVEQAYRRLQRADINRLAPAVFFAGTTGDFSFVSRDPTRDAWHLSQLLHGSTVYGASISKAGSDRILGTRSGAISVVLNSRGEFFPPESLSGVFLSHFTPEVINLASGTSTQAINEFIGNQVSSLKIGGRLIMRNPVVADDKFDIVEFWLRNNDKIKITGDSGTISTAELFEKVCQFKLRMSAEKRGYPLYFPQSITAGDAYSCYPVPQILAHESANIILYPKDIEFEASKPFLSDRDVLEMSARSKGIRMLYSRPEKNPWIKAEVWDGRIKVLKNAEDQTDQLTTNYVYVGERVASIQGVEIVPLESKEIEKPAFLKTGSYIRIRPGVGNVGDIFDLIERPKPTLDLAPWCIKNGEVHVLVRDYPRPIITINKDAFDQSRTAGYTSEQISAMIELDASKITNEDLRAETAKVLKARIGISAAESFATGKADVSYTSPSSISEIVFSLTPEVDYFEGSREITGGFTGELATKGQVRFVQGIEILRAAHLGGIADSRLERMVYEILLSKKASVGSWLPSELKLKDQDTSKIKVASGEQALDVPKELTFEKTDQSKSFMSVYTTSYEERNASGEVIGRTELEHAAPSESSGFSSEKILVLPVIRTKTFDGIEKMLIGVEHRDLPGVQVHNPETSYIATVPDFRIEKSSKPKKTLDDVKQKLLERFNIKGTRFVSAGASFYTSNGTMPEKENPYFLEIDAASAIRTGAKLTTETGDESDKKSDLIWVDPEELFKIRDQIPDSNLKTMLLRFMHASGKIHKHTS